MSNEHAEVVTDRGTYWSKVYGRSAVTEVSWFQKDPRASLDLIAVAGADVDEPIIDVGGGASALVDKLVGSGYQDITVLDLAVEALGAAQSRLAPSADKVHWIAADLLNWQPPRRYRVWHDRAVFHFLTEAGDRNRYRTALQRALAPGGHVVIGTFAADGPKSCSGLPTARYTAAALAAEFESFRVVRELREEHRTPTGTVQPFTWLLLAAPER
jgi:trans-aconitate methyltransferase